MSEERQKKVAQVHHEKMLSKRMRGAIGFCKDELEIFNMKDIEMLHEERVNFEKCLT